MRVSSPAGLVLLTMGLLMLLASTVPLGTLLFCYLPDSSVKAHELAGMPPLTAEALARAPIGTKVLIQGRLSSDNPAHTVVTRRGETARFVAYTCVKYYISTRPRDSGLNWARDATETPPLAIDVADGRVWIEGEYSLGVKPHTLRDGAPEDLGRDCDGYFSGDVVVAYGTVVSRPRGRTVHAQALTTETVDEVVEWAVFVLPLLRRLGFALVTLGLLLAVVGLWLCFPGVGRGMSSRAPGREPSHQA
jgi:hypothetical protein